LQDVNGDDDTALAAAQKNLQRVMDDYVKSPRQVSALWGQRPSTALGVTVARAAANAVIPERGVPNTMKRFALAAPLLIATVAVLARGAFVVASAILINALLVPKLTDAAAGVTWVAGAVLTWVLFAKFVRGREGYPLRVWSTGIITTGAYVFGAITIFAKGWRFTAPAGFPMAEWPWQIHDGRADDTVLAMIAVGLLVALASSLLWVWAKPAWRITVSVVSGAVMALWVPAGAWRPPEDLTVAGEILSLFGSMWIPALLLLLVTTAATIAARPEKRDAPFVKQ
jgi:hypothetical protein